MDPGPSDTASPAAAKPRRGFLIGLARFLPASGVYAATLVTGVLVVQQLEPHRHIVFDAVLMLLFGGLPYHVVLLAGLGVAGGMGMRWWVLSLWAAGLATAAIAAWCLLL